MLYVPTGQNVEKFFVLHTQCMYVLCMDVRTNSGYFTCVVNLLVFVTDKESVYCAVRAEC